MKSSCFNLFRNGKYGLFLSQKVGEKMISTDYWTGLALNFLVMGNMVFFGPRNWWKDDIYWLLSSSCFELFGDGKYSLSFSQNVDGNIIFTWYFWALYDIPGPGKYVFLLTTFLKQYANVYQFVFSKLFPKYFCRIDNDAIQSRCVYETAFVSFKA